MATCHLYKQHMRALWIELTTLIKYLWCVQAAA